MDLGTLIGGILGSALIWMAIILGKSVGAFISVNDLLLVFGGTVSLLMIKHQLKDVYNISSIFGKSLFVSHKCVESTIYTIQDMANIARNDGVLALEKVKSADTFMQHAIDSATDGMDPAHLEAMLRSDLDARGKRHQRGITLCKDVGFFTLLMGIIATFIGGVQLVNTEGVVLSLAAVPQVAIPMFYGFVVCAFTCALAGKLEFYSSDERFVDEIIIKGIKGIQHGINPRLLTHSLKGQLPPAQRGSIV